MNTRNTFRLSLALLHSVPCPDALVLSFTHSYTPSLFIRFQDGGGSRSTIQRPKGTMRFSELNGHGDHCPSLLRYFVGHCLLPARKLSLSAFCVFSPSSHFFDIIARHKKPYGADRLRTLIRFRFFLPPSVHVRICKWATCLAFAPRRPATFPRRRSSPAGRTIFSMTTNQSSRFSPSACMCRN